MLGRHHLALSIMWGFNIIESGDFTDYKIAFASLAIGALLPDVDAPSSKLKKGDFGIIKARKLGIAVFYGAKFLFFYPYAALVSLLRKDAFKHRKSMHSICALFVLLLFLYYPVKYLGYLEYLFPFALGFLFHLFQDGVTVSGIYPFYPLSSFALKGGFVTGSMPSSVLFDLYSAALFAYNVGFFNFSLDPVLFLIGNIFFISFIGIIIKFFGIKV